MDIDEYDSSRLIVSLSVILLLILAVYLKIWYTSLIVLPSHINYRGNSKSQDN
jgi:hypothetical protein